MDLDLFMALLRLEEVIIGKSSSPPPNIPDAWGFIQRL